ncbi:uncharacterized protein LOC115694557 isoform X6 [Syzygium oleosum]|uniref:uncharacterized protein LOC115694557 isoform X6 n=1 Tax=Syzygium oleosum TaxID=219896 RepID=UPI0024B94CE6|nr:uncharacterized protein LOC115694557 isoform X6 [Syzygium oleosum]
MEMSFYDLSSCKSSVNSVQRISQCPKKTHKAKVFRIKRRGIFTAPIVSFFFHAYVMNFKPSSCLMYAGIKKTYWITCNVDRDVHQLPLDRKRYPSNFVVRPHDLNRLLANFQSSLQETTIIATERNSEPSDAASEFGGKAVESRSYIDSTKENDSLLHTQLWIDPAEEFVQYAHSSNPVDVTFAVKELKAFPAFCEGCEVDIDLYFEKAGEPILMAPKIQHLMKGPLPILMLYSYWPPCLYHNYMKVILDLRQMKCRARLILGKLLENSQRGIEQVLPRFHLIIPEYGLNSRVSDPCSTIISMMAKKLNLLRSKMKCCVCHQEDTF